MHIRVGSLVGSFLRQYVWATPGKSMLLLYTKTKGTDQPAHLLNIINIFDNVFIKGVKKVRSAIKLSSFYFSYYVSSGINVTGIL